MKQVTLSHDQGLYVIPCGNGYSCLGFDVCETWLQGYADWLVYHAQTLPELKASRATIERYAEYEAIRNQAAKFAAQSGKRCNIHLTPELIGKEGKLVQVTAPDGYKHRFTVGKSTGWAPCHLEIKTRRSISGCAVYLPKGATVIEVRK
jgi:hypothetical protein